MNKRTQATLLALPLLTLAVHGQILLISSPPPQDPLPYTGCWGIELPSSTFAITSSAGYTLFNNGMQWTDPTQGSSSTLYRSDGPGMTIDPWFLPDPVLAIAPMSLLTFSNLTIGCAYQLQHQIVWYWSNQPTAFTATNTDYAEMVPGVASSTSYRLALNPVPSQAFATPQMVNGFVVGATVTSGGSGYATNPGVSIAGGGGSNATAVSKISGGVVTEVKITAAGFGYTNTPTIRITAPPAAAVFPMVEPVMRLDSANLAPYDNYQIQYQQAAGGSWGRLDGGLFSPTSETNSQYLFITNGVGFFRLKYEP